MEYYDTSSQYKEIIPPNIIQQNRNSDTSKVVYRIVYSARTSPISFSRYHGAAYIFSIAQPVINAWVSHDVMSQHEENSVDTSAAIAGVVALFAFVAFSAATIWYVLFGGAIVPLLGGIPMIVAGFLLIRLEKRLRTI